jgi:hypothetical protein
MVESALVIQNIPQVSFVLISFFAFVDLILEEDKREIIKDQGSQASRALITMRRSRAEGANNLKVYNVQDYFVINRCTLKVGIDMSKMEHLEI